MTHTNEISEQALRQALRLRNEQKPQLPPDFAARVEARMERRNNRRSLSLWIAAAGIAASVLIGVIWSSLHKPSLLPPLTAQEREQMEILYMDAELQAQIYERTLMEKVEQEEQRIMQQVMEAQAKADERFYTLIDD